MGILEVLTLIFFVLKVTGTSEVAQWDWIWIFSPLWIGYSIALVLWVVAFAVGAAKLR